MKKLYFIACLLITSGIMNAQNLISNGDMEIWSTTSNEPQPKDWRTNNSNIPIYLIAIPITQSSDAHSGTSAAYGEVIVPAGTTGNYPPYMSTIDIPITRSNLTLNFWYKLYLSGVDALHVIVKLYAGDTFYTPPISGSEEYINVNTSTYTSFSLPIKDTSTAQNAITCVVTFEILNPTETNYVLQQRNTTLGSAFYLDDIELIDNLTGISGIENTKNGVSYPNPVHDKLHVTISGQNNQETLITLMDPSGRVVIEKKSTGIAQEELNVANLSSGIYILSLRSAGENRISQIVVQ